MFRVANAEGQPYDADLHELIANKSEDPAEQVRLLCDVLDRVVSVLDTPQAGLAKAIIDMLA